MYVAAAIFIAGFMMWQGRYRLLTALGVAIAVPVAASSCCSRSGSSCPLPKGPLERMLGY